MGRTFRLLKIAALALSGLCLCSCMAHAPLHIVMINGELFFVLEGKPHIKSVSVEQDQTAESPRVTMWFAGCSSFEEYNKEPAKGRIETENDKCWLHQIKYGAGGTYLPSLAAPRELRRGREYLVRIDMPGGLAAMGTFSIVGDNSVALPVRYSAAAKKDQFTLETADGEFSYPYTLTDGGEAGHSVLTTGSPEKMIRRRR